LLLLISVAIFGSAAVYLLYPSGGIPFTHVKPGGAAIIDTLTELNPNPMFEEEATGYLTAAGMYVDVYNSSTVSVDFMKSFPAGYDLIVFRVHSGTSRHGVFYFTSEPYDESKHQPEQFRDEVRPAKDYEGHSQVFAFGPKFVDTYLKNRFQNAMIIGMGCFGAGTSYGSEEKVAIENVDVESGPNLADAFHRQGASVLIGWDKLVSLSFSDEASLRLIKALAVDHMTVKQAVDTTNQEFGPDPVYRSVLVFYPNENGDQVLRIQALEDAVKETLERLLLSVYSMMPRPRIWQPH
jgi:hypothetical protein